MSVNGISGSSAVATASVQSAPVKGKDSDGDNDGSKGATAKIGPAAILSLTNTAKPDLAAGDPDHDGK